MVNPVVILRKDKYGVLRDQYGNFCNEQGQILNADGYYSFTKNYDAGRHQKPYQISFSFTRNYEASFYQSPPAPTRLSKLESMLEQMLEEQQRATENWRRKFEAPSSHVKKLDIQVAQSDESVKKQVDPKYNCSAVKLRSGEELNPFIQMGYSIDEFVELEEIEEEIAAESSASIDSPQHRSTPFEFSESVEYETRVSIDTLNASIDTDEKSADNTGMDICIDRCHISVDRHRSPSETSNIVKPKPILEQVHRPKVSHPLPPKHLMDPISPKQLLGFQKMVRRIPHALTFEEACEYRPLLSHFRDCRESIEDIEVLFLEARHTPPLRKLKKRAELNSRVRKSPDLSEEDDEVSKIAPASIDTCKHRSIPVQESVKDVSKEQASIDTPGVSIDRAEKPVIDTSQDTSIDRRQSSIDRRQSSIDRRQSKPAIPNIKKSKPVEERVYKPKVPFPRNPRKSQQELYEAKCRAIMNKLTVEIPLIDAIKTTPVVNRCLKKMLAQDMRKEESVMMTSEVCSAVIQNRIPDFTLQPPRKKQRYTLPEPKPPDFINKTFRGINNVLQLTKPRDSRRVLVFPFDDSAGKRSVPPILPSHHVAVPKFLGRPHALNAYTPPWMRRQPSARHSLPHSRPPDA